MPNTALHASIDQNLETWRGRIEEVARDIHAHPELSFEEHHATAALTALLAEAGFEVERGVAELPTAFNATIGSGDLTVAFFLEYDALPVVGHACGHNIIAGASLGAALALAPLVDELGITLKALGTPAEEHGGGKALMLERGAFDGISLALMVHPSQDGLGYNPTGGSSTAVGRFRAIFTGLAAHAAAAPHEGINAGDAATLAQVALGLLRQQVPDEQRFSSYIAEAGHVTNIITDRSVVEFEARAYTLHEYESLLARIRRCFEGAALSTGTELVIEPTEPLYEPLIQDDDLAAQWVNAIGAFGRDVSTAGGMGSGSTDMGNVSQVIPSLHPHLPIPGADAPIHSHRFTSAANSDAAYEVMFEACAALARVVASAGSDPEQRHRLLAAAYQR